MAVSEVQAITLLHQLAALQTTTLLCAGLYFHEFVVHLRDDWRIFRRPDAGRAIMARLAKWTYLACRTLALIYSVCLTVIAFPAKPDCHTLIKTTVSTGFLSNVCASALLSIRVAAIWTWDKRILSLLVVNTLVILACAIYVMAKVDSTYDSMLRNCTLDGVHSGLLPSAALLVGDFLTLALLLTGLQRNWHDARQFRLWSVLWTQGLLYLFLAATIEIPTVVLLVMDLSPIMNSMLVTPEAIVLAIGATRLFRSLNSSLGGECGESEMFTNGVSRSGMSTLQLDDVQLASMRSGQLFRE